MFSILGPSHFTDGVVRLAALFRGPQLTKVDNGSSAKVFLFPLGFHRFEPHCTLRTLEWYLGVPLWRSKQVEIGRSKSGVKPGRI